MSSCARSRAAGLAQRWMLLTVATRAAAGADGLAPMPGIGRFNGAIAPAAPALELLVQTPAPQRISNQCTT
jgi:hypothetical protein